MAYLVLHAMDSLLRERVSRRALERGLREVGLGPRFRILVDDDEPDLPDHGGRGVLIGSIFASDTTSQLNHLDWDAVVKTDGRRLIDGAWGRYVALFWSMRGAPAIVRDPSGALPVYLHAEDDLAFATSDASLAADVGLLEPNIDWTFVAEEVGYPGQRGHRTGIDGLTELAPGEYAEFIEGRWRAKTLWSPWIFAARARQHQDPTVAAQDLFNAVKQAATGLSAGYDVLTLELSGGLDSSITAAALADHPGVHAVNGATVNAEGDERGYAQAVAGYCGLDLDCRSFEGGGVDLTLCSAPRSARPGRPAVLGGVNATIWGHATDHGSQAIFSGVGGDSVFCLLNSAAPMVDRVRAGFSPAGVASTLRDLAMVNDATTWAVARQALRIRRRATLWPPQAPDVSFLKVADRPDPPEHPWLSDPPPGALPGRFRHVASVAYIQGYMDGQRRGPGRPMIAPLLAQPVLEAVFATPTWFWVDGGRDRAVARRAFVGKLPDRILTRRSKGRIDRMVREVFERNRPVLRDLLVGGVLSGQGLLDTRAIETAITAPIDPRRRDFRRLMELADVEVWLRSWLR